MNIPHGELSGKIVAEKWLEEIKQTASSLRNKPGFAILQVGDNAASNVYIKNKIKVAEQLNFHVVYHKIQEDTEINIAKKILHDLNTDPKIHGIIIQLPLPNTFKQLIYMIAPEKDIDGLGLFQQANLALNMPGLRPCTPTGVLRLMEYYNIPFKARACVVGRSILVGQSLALMLLHKGATITVTHLETANLTQHLKEADVVFLAAGNPGFIKAEMLNSNAIVIDIAITSCNGVLYGDLDKEAYKYIQAYTPVPGGIGPMTIAALMHNVLQAYQQQTAEKLIQENNKYC